MFLAACILCADLKAQPMATCDVNDGVFRDQIYLYNNFQYNSALNRAPSLSRRDPSGKAYIQLPSINPQRMYFIGWDASFIEVAPFGWRVIGRCNFFNGMPVQNHYGANYRQLHMGSGHVRGLRNQYIPKEYTNESQRYSAPLYASEQEAKNCANTSYLNNGKIDEERFYDCMLNEMLGKKEAEVYNCTKKSQGDETKLALCSLAALGGQNEKAAVSQISSCYSRHQDDYKQYPLCMAQQNMSHDAANLLACIEKQSQQGDVTFYGTAACYGGGALDLTPEQQIALECAVGTGGEPYSFASCAGGRLTARELSKCLTNGIGGRGCFGTNNDIVKALSALGVDMSAHYGPNNTIVKTWNNAINDLRNGPGNNNEVTKAFRNAANDITNGPGKNNDIVKAAETIIPGFKW